MVLARALEDTFLQANSLDEIQLLDTLVQDFLWGLRRQAGVSKEDTPLFTLTYAWPGGHPTFHDKACEKLAAVVISHIDPGNVVQSSSLLCSCLIITFGQGHNRWETPFILLYADHATPHPALRGTTWPAPTVPSVSPDRHGLPR